MMATGESDKWQRTKSLLRCSSPLFSLVKEDVREGKEKKEEKELPPQAAAAAAAATGELLVRWCERVCARTVTAGVMHCV